MIHIYITFLGLSFEQSPKWFTIDEQNYIQNQLNYQESTNHNFQINSNQIDNGIYSTYVHIESNATGAISIPVDFNLAINPILGM